MLTAACMYAPAMDKPCKIATSVNGSGYGRHREAWEAVHGPVPAGLELDHTCGVKACEEVSHLEPVTSRENKVRAGTIGKEVCKRGHVMDGPNLIHRPKGGANGIPYVVCRRCQYDSTNAANRRRREAARAHRG